MMRKRQKAMDKGGLEMEANEVEMAKQKVEAVHKNIVQEGCGDLYVRHAYNRNEFIGHGWIDAASHLPAANRREEEPTKPTHAKVLRDGAGACVCGWPFDGVPRRWHQVDQHVRQMECDHEMKTVTTYHTHCTKNCGYTLCIPPIEGPSAPTLEEEPAKPTVIEPVPCYVCRAPVFLRESGAVVAHYDGNGDKCIANETIAPIPNAPALPASDRQWADEMARLLDLYLRDYKPTDVARGLVEKYRELPGNVGRDIFDSNPAYTDKQLQAVEGAIKLNQYGLTREEWTLLVDFGSKLHNALMDEPEGEDWYDGQSLKIMESMVEVFKAGKSMVKHG